MKIINYCYLVILVSLSWPAMGQDGSENETMENTQEVKEVQYVTDKLRLSLYKNASDKSGTLKLLISGDVLDVLEKKGPYSKVRTRSGETGWVKNGFLVRTPTDSFLLLEEQQKNEILARQIEQFSDTKTLVEDYETTISKISEDFSNTQKELEKNSQEVQELREENSNLHEQIEATLQGKLGLSDVIVLLKQYWYIIAALIITLVLVGFLIGREMVEAQVRRRFQGVKVW